MHYWDDYGEHHARWMWWAIGLPLGILFWGCVVWGIVALGRSMGRNETSSNKGLVPTRPEQPNTAKTILDERFARGEIDEDEYRRRVDTLKSS